MMDKNEAPDETKQAETAREAREDEAEQALEDAQDESESEQAPEVLQEHESDEEQPMATKKHDEYKPGDEVIVNEGGSDVEGVVRSIQLKAGKVDVQLYQKGHLKHGLIQAFPAEHVRPRSGKSQSA
jgi:hypothetical protein